MKREKLTPMQWRILTAIIEHGKASFTGHHARKRGFGVFPVPDNGCMIRAYQTPQWFLLQRGLISKIERTDNEWRASTLYEITPKGRAALTIEKS